MNESSAFHPSVKMNGFFSNQEGVFFPLLNNALLIICLQKWLKSSPISARSYRIPTMLPKISKIIIIVVAWLMAASILYVFIVKLQVFRDLFR
jgi:hypothetical protein